MRTNIVIDDELMEATLKATGLKTKREAVELGLRTLLRLNKWSQTRFPSSLFFRGRPTPFEAACLLPKASISALNRSPPKAQTA